jgi:hypothetical protein
VEVEVEAAAVLVEQIVYQHSLEPAHSVLKNPNFAPENSASPLNFSQMMMEKWTARIA